MSMDTTSSMIWVIVLYRNIGGKGYATEAATAFLNYGFNRLNLEVINAWADSENKGSRNVLEKIGLQYVNTFQHHGEEEVWYEIKNPNK